VRGVLSSVGQVQVAVTEGLRRRDTGSGEGPPVK
jgi:hypothetical protein